VVGPGRVTAMSRISAHLAKVDHKAVIFDVAASAVFAAGGVIGYATQDTKFGLFVAAVLFAVAATHLGGALWELFRPESLDQQAEIARHLQRIDELLDDVDRRDAENDELRERCAALEDA
jgi:hypothetical protein